jgi:hypothetical protein
MRVAYRIAAEADAARALGAMCPEICGHVLLARVIMHSMAYFELCEMDREFCGQRAGKKTQSRNGGRGELARAGGTAGPNFGGPGSAAGGSL